MAVNNSGFNGAAQEQVPVISSRTIFPMEGLTVANQSVWNSYLDENPTVGYMMIETTTAGNLLPVIGSQIVIQKQIGDNMFTLYELTTDVNGQTPKVSLPTPDKALSLYPGHRAPYASYSVVVKNSKYRDVFDEHVPIFEGVSSIQNVNMIPVGVADATYPITVNETEPSL